MTAETMLPTGGEAFEVSLPISPAMADVAGAPASMIERIVRTVGVRTSGSALPAPSSTQRTAGETIALRKVRDLLEVEYHDDGRVACVAHKSGGLREIVAILDAALASPPHGKAERGVTVKPLCWEKHDIDGTFWTSEVSVTGEHKVSFDGKEWVASRGVSVIGRAPSCDAAKACSQRFHDGRIRSALIAQPEAPASLAEGWKPTHRHVLSGNEYAVVGQCQVQCKDGLTDYEMATVYRGKDGELWVRRRAEFEERFAALARGSAS